MILVDNIKIFKKAYPISWNNIKAAETLLNRNLVQLEVSNKGYKTLYLEEDGKKVYMHSKYNPIREAEAIVEEYEDIQENSTVIFYGTGLGYHIDAFLNKHKNINYYIYEPIPELLYQYLSNQDIKDLPNKNLENIVLGNTQEAINSFLNNIVNKNAEELKLVVFPVHKQLFNEEYTNFIDLFKKAIKDKRMSIHVDYAFQENWTTNSMRNFKTVLKTPNILLDKSGVFSGKPVILVAAGPSLNEEIENLRYIKKNNLAYIISVGSAINTLLHHNIYPHAATTYDPKDVIWAVFKHIIDKKIVDIPLIFGSSVGHQTTKRYPGKMLHMITSQDSVSNYYLKGANGEDIPFVSDSPSIAIITLQLLSQLKVGKIILAGQNLALKGDKDYAEGISYRKDGKSKFVGDDKNYISVKDVHGNNVYTLENYNTMRILMEEYIETLTGIDIINATKGGADIKGTKFMPLENVIKEYLNEPVVNKNWSEEITSDYNRDHLKFKKKKMDMEYRKVLDLIDKYYNILNKIEKSIVNRNFKQAEKEYIQLDNILSKIEKNDFFAVFILPMNRLRYQILGNSIDRLNAEKNPSDKGNKIVSSFKGFMDLCRNSMEKIEPIFKEMNGDIDTYLSK